MSVYCFQLHVLHMHLFSFHFPVPLLLLSVFYPVISEIPRYRSAINKNNILMLSFLSDLILLCVYLSQKGQVEMLSRMQYYCSVQQYRLHTAIIARTEFE